MAEANEIVYVTIRPEYAAELEAIEYASFPTAERAELLSESDLLAQCRVFPEGGFVALDGDRPVGMGLGIFVDFDFEHTQHSMDEVCGVDGVSGHTPDGAWYYGTDISVHPDYRRRGIGKRFYELRMAFATAHNRKGIVAGGVIPGFTNHKHELSAGEYIDKVRAGELYDPTLSFQLENGFRAEGPIAGYLTDPAVDNYACLIVWDNPAYRS